jgi:hypothetical protein
VRCVFCGQGDGFEVLGEGSVVQVKSVGFADACDFCRLRIEPEQVAGGFLLRSEIDAVAAPVDQIGIFVEFCG